MERSEPGQGVVGLLPPWVGYWLLLLVTAGSLVVPVHRLLEGVVGWSMTAVVEVGLPFMVALGLVALAYELRARAGELGAARVGVWVVGGWLFFALLALFVLTHQLVGIGRVHDPVLVVNNTGLGGALVGGLVGWYDAERRADRARLDRVRRRLGFLNRVLRHDVRNDVSVIIGNAELLQGEVEDEEALGFILDSAKHVVELTHLARAFEESQEETSLERVDLLSVVRGAVEHARSSFPQARIEAVLEPLEGVFVEADALLGGVFENVVRNGVQHNDREVPVVRVEGFVEEEMAGVRVLDDGPGIPVEVRGRLFKEGVKGPESDGTGLGLYLVKTLVDQYGGTVEVEDRSPRGSVVVIRLPILEA